jgi:hypothetical protein
VIFPSGELQPASQASTKVFKIYSRAIALKTPQFIPIKALQSPDRVQVPQVFVAVFKTEGIVRVLGIRLQDAQTVFQLADNTGFCKPESPIIVAEDIVLAKPQRHILAHRRDKPPAIPPATAQERNVRPLVQQGKHRVCRRVDRPKEQKRIDLGQKNIVYGTAVALDHQMPAIFPQAGPLFGHV